MVDLGVNPAAIAGGAALPEPVIGVSERAARRGWCRVVLDEVSRNRILPRQRNEISGNRVSQRIAVRVFECAERIVKLDQGAVTPPCVREVRSEEHTSELQSLTN